ncbi:MAG: hypothetical protein HZA10_05325 [Nitrospirae bacterium]|nr:hypothetical protein [Nitrospirota bacterium]
MAGTVTGNSLFFNIHSLVRIKAEGLVPEADKLLLRHFRLFPDKDGLQGSKADILISQLRHKNMPFLQTRNTRDPSAFWINKHEGNFFIVFGSIKKPDILIKLSEKMELFYTPKKGCAWRIFDCLVLCIQLALQKKGGMLFHGSVMNQADKAVLLIGPGGIGKSILVLNLLKEGWNYLSEDKFILFDGKAYIFRDYIPLTDYHFDIFPWLYGMRSLDKNTLRHTAFRKRFKKLAESYLPSSVLQHLKYLYNPPMFTDVADICPDCKIIHTAEPSTALILIPGAEFSFAEAGKEEIIGKIKAIQWSAFPMFEDVLRLLSLYGYESRHDIDNIIEKSLSVRRFYAVTIPNESPDNIYRNFKKCLSQVS